MNMPNIQRSQKYMEMLGLAEEYYKLVKSGKGYEDESLELKKKLDSIEESFIDDPAYLALLRAERKSK